MMLVYIVCFSFIIYSFLCYLIKYFFIYILYLADIYVVRIINYGELLNEGEHRHDR